MLFICPSLSETLNVTFTVSPWLYATVVVFVKLNVNPKLVSLSSTCSPSTFISALLALIPAPLSVALMLIVGIVLFVPDKGMLSERMGGVVSLTNNVIFTLVFELPALSVALTGREYVPLRAPVAFVII